MTPNALRELAAEMRSIMCDDEMSRGEIYRWADKLESLAGECAVVPRVPTEGMCDAAMHVNADLWATDVIDLYRAMIEAAERQEKP